MMNIMKTLKESLHISQKWKEIKVKINLRYRAKLPTFKHERTLSKEKSQQKKLKLQMKQTGSSFTNLLRKALPL